MKKIAYITTFLLLLTIYSYGQADHIKYDTIKGRSNAMDTVIRRKTELSFGKTFPNNYKRDEATVQALRPYFVTEIVNPGNLSNVHYTNRQKEAKENLSLAKSELLGKMKVSQRIREHLAGVHIFNEGDLNAISFVYIPVYYPTPNIVFYKNGENIAKYYNLGRGVLKYMMLRNNTLIGYLNFDPNGSKYFKSNFFPAHPEEVKNYSEIVKFGGKLIAESISISNNPNYIGGGSISMFGYVEQNHLVIFYYDESIIQTMYVHSTEVPKQFFRKEYTHVTIESFFSGKGITNMIEGWLNAEKNRIKK